MRFSTVAVTIGLSVLGGAYAGVIPGDLENAPAYRTRDIAIKNSKREVTGQLFPRAGGAPGQPLPKPVIQPKPVVQPVRPGNPGTTRFKPLTQEQLRKEVPARPVGLPKPTNLRDSIDRLSKNDRSDWVVRARCGKSKRDLMALFHKRMSGDDKTLTWDEWQEVFREVENALRTDTRILYPIELRMWGGGSGIARNSRGEGGRTGDIDFSHHPETDDIIREAFQKAIDKVYAGYIGLVDPDFINDLVDSFDDEAKQVIVREGKVSAFAGEMLKIYHAPWMMQLINKMDRITNTRFDNGYTVKDQKDAAKFLEEAKAEAGGKITLKNLEEWGKRLGFDAASIKNMIEDSADIIQEGFEGFADDVMQIVKDLGC